MLSPTGLLKKSLKVGFTPQFFFNFYSLGLLGDQKCPSTCWTCKIPTFETSLQGSFKDLILASEINFDLGVQRSFLSICAKLTYKLVYKIWRSYCKAFWSYLFISHVITFFHSFIRMDRWEKVSHRALLKVV